MADLNAAIEASLNGRSILFTGAGFSYGAESKSGAIKAGKKLAEDLAKLCDVDEAVDLDVIADEFIEQHGIDRLINFLFEHYRCARVKDYHEGLAELPWIRTYTTNYDNVFELACSNISRKVQSLVSTNSINDTKLTENDCVHINGFIDRLSRSDLNNSFKLTRSSYMTDSFENNEWSRLFRSDVLSAEAIVFIGYSMYDLDVSRIIFPDEDLRRKSYFIVSPYESDLECKRLGRIGNVFRVGVEQFWRNVESAKTHFVPRSSDDIPLVSFRDFSGVGANAPQKASDRDVLGLLWYGHLKPELIWDSQVSGKDDSYVLHRQVFKKITKEIEDNKDVVVVSHLGNGKSVLINDCAIWAKKHQRPVFLYDRRKKGFETELSWICQHDDPLVIFENYETCLGEIADFQQRRSGNSSLIVTSRMSTHEIQYEKLFGVVDPDKIEEYDINELYDDDINALSTYLEKFSGWGEFVNLNRSRRLNLLTDDCQRQFHAILLKLLNSKNIKDKFAQEIRRLDQSPDAYELIVCVLILEQIGINTDGNLLMDLMGGSVNSVLRRHQKELENFIGLEGRTINARSSVLAQFVLSELADAKIVQQVLKKTVLRAGKLSRDADRRFNDVVNKLVRYREVQAIMPAQGKRAFLIDYYEEIKNIPWLRKAAHFWLQYAIARMAFDEYEIAGQYFDTSYSLAEKHDNYDTTYMDNHYSRFLLETAVKRVAKDPFECFQKAKAILLNQSSNENLHYPYRVAAGIRDYYDEFKSEFTDDQEREVFDIASKLVARIDNLPERTKNHKHVRNCKTKLGPLVGD